MEQTMATKMSCFIVLVGLFLNASSSHVTDSDSDPREDSSHPIEGDHHRQTDTTVHVPSHNRHHKDSVEIPSSRHHKDPVEIPSSRLKLFEQTDTDGDGFVTKQEYAQHNGDIEINSTDVEDLFTTYDRDNDGQLSEQEFVDQSSPWEVINECEFQVMQKCNAELDQSMNDGDSEWDEPLCHGLQSYLNCVTNKGNTENLCSIEEYIISVQHTALVYRTSGLCPDLDITLDFDIEIDYALPEVLETEYDYDDEESDEESDELQSDFSSVSISYHGDERRIRSLTEVDETISHEDRQYEVIDDKTHDRVCSTSSLLQCNTQFESGISLHVDTKSKLEGYRQCVLENTRHCGRERQTLLLREGLKIIAKTHRAVFQSEFTKDPVKG